MVSPKEEDSTLTCEIKSHIKNDLEGQYANAEIYLLLLFLIQDLKETLTLMIQLMHGRGLIVKEVHHKFLPNEGKLMLY